MTRSKKAAKKAPVIDPYLPANGNFGYRVSRYELDLEYKVAINRLAGSATITAVTLAALRTFTLDLSDALTVTKVSVNGRRPAQFSCSGGKLHIALSSTLPAGAAMSIVVRYGGTPRPIRSHWGEVGFEELTDGVLVAGQPNGAASWFPCDDHPSAKASYRIQISTENPYRAIANGELSLARTRAAHDDVDLRAGRADVDLSGHAADRRCTSRTGCRKHRCRCTPRCPPGCSATSTTTSAGSRR